MDEQSIQTTEQPTLMPPIMDPLDPTQRAMMRAIVLEESFSQVNQQKIAQLTAQNEQLQEANRRLNDNLQAITAERDALKAEASGAPVARLREAGKASA